LAREDAAGQRGRHRGEVSSPRVAFLAHPQLIICHASDIRVIAMLQLNGAKTMGMKATDVLKHLDFENMTKTEKAALKKKFMAHKEHLKKSMAAIDKGLAELAKKK
jgi:hypothetical protein